MQPSPDDPNDQDLGALLRYAGLLMRKAASLGVHRREEQEEIVQDVFVTAVEKRAHLSHPAAWLSRVLWLKVKNWRRKRVDELARTVVQHERFLNGGEDQEALRRLSQRDPLLMQIVKEVLLEYPLAWRRAFVLVVFEGIDKTAAGQELGVSKTSIRKRVSEITARIAREVSIVADNGGEE